jgi:hypothetical protein
VLVRVLVNRAGEVLAPVLVNGIVLAPLDHRTSTGTMPATRTGTRTTSAARAPPPARPF